MKVATFLARILAQIVSGWFKPKPIDEPPRESSVVIMPPVTPGPMETIIINAPHTDTVTIAPPPQDGDVWGYRLSDHFTVAEFIASDTAKARGIDNTMPPALYANAIATAKGLELIRAALGNRALILLSGYRCPALNKAVGGVDNSDHLEALAADIICPGFGTPYEIARAIAMLDVMAHVDQLIYEHERWVHVGFGHRKRGQILTINKHGKFEGIVRTVGA